MRLLVYYYFKKFHYYFRNKAADMNYFLKPVYIKKKNFYGYFKLKVK